MKIFMLKKSRQKGVALFVCLMILLILSVLGITAMRMMSTQSMMAASSQAAEISYSAGASAINQMIAQAEADPDSGVVLPAVGGAAKTLCLVAGESSAVDCSSSVAGNADIKGVSTARVTVSTINTDADSPEDAAARLKYLVTNIGTVPGAAPPGYYTFTSQGSVDAMGISVTQTQETIFPRL
jgi:Tfp pilus assembly protein PilX